MSASSLKNNSYAKNWFIITVVCAVFSAVYEYFSHGVVSYRMVFLFTIPLFLGMVPSVFLKAAGMEMPSRLWQDGVLVLLFGTLLSGVFEIYGTEIAFTQWYFIAGLALLCAGVSVNILHCIRK